MPVSRCCPAQLAICALRKPLTTLSLIWRSERYFAGLRLSQGDFDTDSILDNPVVNSQLISTGTVRHRQAQFSAGTYWRTDSLSLTPSASIQAGTFEHNAHIAQSPVLEAKVPGYTEDYSSVRVGMQLTSTDWLKFTDDMKWKPHLKFDSIHTNSKDAGNLTLRQSDKLGVLSFNTNAGLRSMPDVVNSLSFSAKVKSSANDQAQWKFGFAGLEADGEHYYAAMAAYQLRF